jgi:nitrogen fixation/metabolism regulation signal transduction histidine kinase
MLEKRPGKLNTSDERVGQLLSWTPWLSLILVTLPLPIVFLVLFLVAGTTTESAAIYLLLSFVSMGLGLVVGLIILIFLLLYRRRWHGRLRDRLAADGITAAEVPWFASELSSEERKTWGELKQKNVLLADAYCETLAARLTATRIIARARGETLKVERQINRTRNLQGVDTSSLLGDLIADRQRSEGLRKEATARLSEVKARLQTIEAAANRSLSRQETDSMLRRLAASQEHFPLALEMASLEQEALREIGNPEAGSKKLEKLPQRPDDALDTFEP